MQRCIDEDDFLRDAINADAGSPFLSFFDEWSTALFPSVVVARWVAS